jgi:branched-chain amino acid transport system permease protein
MQRQRLIWLIIVVALAAALPFFIHQYRAFQLTLVLAYAIAILGLNMLTGYNGQISVGHSAFYAVGAYTAAILMDVAGVPYWLVVPIAGILCLGFGFAFGLPALRLEGHYLALATFALALATPQLLKYPAIEPWTGGTKGIALNKPDSPWELLNADQWLYLFTLAITVFMFVAGRNLLQGRLGRAMVAIRDHPTAASAMGINTALVKSVTFGISALYTGVAGALGAIAVQYVAPDAFNFFFGISLLVGVAIGGFATISGAFYGALFIVFVPNIADDVSRAAPWAIYGAVLIAVTYVMPGGVAGLLASWWMKFRGKSG